MGFPNKEGRPRKDREQEARDLAALQPNRIDPNRIYNSKEAAIVLGVHLHKLQSWLRSGELPGRNAGGSKGWMIPGQVLIEFVSDGNLHPVEQKYK
jgi:hypothetical protein